MQCLVVGGKKSKTISGWTGLGYLESFMQCLDGGKKSKRISGWTGLGNAGLFLRLVMGWK